MTPSNGPNIEQHFVLSTFVAVFVSMSGCFIEMHTIPANAVSEERHAVVRLRPLAENITWNKEGHVVSIDLTGTVSDEHLDSILELSKLEMLGLTGTDVTDKGIAQLSGLPHLRSLSLAWTKVSDAGIQGLRNAKSLRVLDLNHTGVSDKGIKVVEALPHLRHLFVEDTRVTEQKVQELRQALPNCRIQW